MRNLGLALSLLLFFPVACNDDNEADRLGVGAECTATDECDQDTDQICLTEFAGGYCGIRDCLSDDDCPSASACIAHDDGTNYCFRVCLDKSECNVNRTVDVESNCSANVVFTDGAQGRKACVPPSSGV
jgi:hypothetical protein